MSWLSNAIGGLTGSKGAKDAARSAAAYNITQANDTRARNDALYSPLIERGNEAGASINALLNLSGDTAGARAAYDKYLGSTGYQSRVADGTNAINQNKVTSGLLKSGAALKDLTRFGQDYASAEFENYLNRLGTQQGVGVGAVQGQVGSNNNLLSLLTGNANEAADTFSNASLANGRFVTDLLKSAVGLKGEQRGQSSYANPSNPVRPQQYYTDPMAPLYGMVR